MNCCGHRKTLRNKSHPTATKGRRRSYALVSVSRWCFKAQILQFDNMTDARHKPNERRRALVRRWPGRQPRLSEDLFDRSEISRSGMGSIRERSLSCTEIRVTVAISCRPYCLARKSRSSTYLGGFFARPRNMDALLSPGLRRQNVQVSVANATLCCYRICKLANIVRAPAQNGNFQTVVMI